MKETLCWSCMIPGSGGCSWDDELKPVEGWTAVPTKTDGFDTYRVISCPKYAKMPPKTLFRSGDLLRSQAAGTAVVWAITSGACAECEYYDACRKHAKFNRPQDAACIRKEKEIKNTGGE